MKQKIYVAHVRGHYVAKNKLQQAVSDYLDTLDGKAFTQDQYLQKRREIDAKIKELNVVHKRSKPVDHSWHTVTEANGKQMIFLHYVQAIDFVFISGELEL